MITKEVLVSILVEIPESLHEDLTDFLDQNRCADQDKVVYEALRVYLQAHRMVKSAASN